MTPLSRAVEKTCAKSLAGSACLMLLALALTLVYIAIFRFLDLPHIHSFSLIAGALSAAFIVHRCSVIEWPTFVKIMCLFLPSLWFMGTFMGSLWDLSWDGSAYQMESIIALRKDFNLFFQDAEVIFTNVYANGWWSLLAIVAGIFDNNEAVKVMNYAILIITAILVFGVILAITPSNKKTAAFVTAAIIANPVITSQFFTLYLDGAFYLLQVCLISGLLLLYLKPEHKRLAHLIAFSSIILAVNTKITALYFCVIFCAVFCICLFFRQYGERRIKQETLCLLLSGLLAVFVVGYKPYVSNLLKYKNIIYAPLQDIILGQTPDVMKGKNNIQQFFHSTFSTPNMTFAIPYSEHAPAVQPPLQWQWKVFSIATSEDIRLGGFGPFYALAWGVMIGLCVWLLTKQRVNYYPPIFLTGAFITIVLLFPEPWWVRFVSVAWFIPLIVPSAILLRCKKGRHFLSIEAILSIFIVALSIAWGSYCGFYGIRKNIADNQHLRALLTHEKNRYGSFKLRTTPEDIVGINTWLERMETVGIPAYHTTTIGTECENFIFWSINIEFCGIE